MGDLVKENKQLAPLCLFFSLLKNTKNSSVAMAMQRFFEFFRRKNYGALRNNLFNFFHLVHCFTNLFTFLSISFKMTLHQKILKYSEYSRHF